MGILIIGHRGMGPTSTQPSITSDTLPENSMASFTHALNLGADGLEFDVHLTKDGQVAVIHDDKLNKKLAGANRDGTELGVVSNYTLEQLGNMDIGNGQGIPGLADVMDFMIAANSTYTANTGRTLMIDIELKGEGVAEATYNTIKPYIAAGYVNAEDFVFNSFNWDNLRDLRALDSQLKVIPAIKTEDLFGKDNVTMPGWKVREGATYQPEALEKLQALHDSITCYAFDCIVFDLRPPFVDFCAQNNIGLFTSTSSEAIKAEQLKGQLSLMTAAENRVPVVCFRADHVGETRDLVTTIRAEQALESDRPATQLTTGRKWKFGL